MATTVGLLLSLLTFLISLSSLPLPSLSTINSFVYGGCSQIKYTPNSPYQSNLNSLLTSLVNSATYSAYNKFTIPGPTPQDVLHGLYQCRGDLSLPDCATCVAGSVSQLGVLCSQTCGGAVQLEGCFVKYDNTTFIGVEDKSVVTKKCGPSIGNDLDTGNRRDAVLASLGGAGGLYRVGGALNFQCVAQCQGDLSVSDCQDCVAEAIQRLKTDCAGGICGDMFLAKCYVRCTSSGSQPHVYPNSGYPNSDNPNSYDDISHDDDSNEAEKALAIIFGLLALVALIIIFLPFIKKVFREEDCK